MYVGLMHALRAAICVKVTIVHIIDPLRCSHVFEVRLLAI
jgi:hypothetical protein